METFTSIVASGFAPYMASSLTGNGSMLYYPAVGLVVFAITYVMGIIRSLRYCRDDKGKIKSYGLYSNMIKGIILGIISIIVILSILFIPILKTPLLIMSFIPGISAAADGILVALSYTLFYFSLIYPIWKSC